MIATTGRTDGTAAAVGGVPAGIFGSVRRVLDTVLAILQNRLELMMIELNEEKSRLISVVIWAAALLFLAFMGIVALMLTVVMLLWDHALIVLGSFTGVFLLGALVSFLMIKKKIKGSIPFSETIAQLKKDRAWLQSQR
jgi:uncharacterized membrane protein YqjE